MAHPRLIAQRQAIAQVRLMAAARALVKRHALTEEGKALDSISAKDPALLRAQQTEALADLMEGLAKTSKPAEAKQEQPPATVETVIEKPLETTETVEIVESPPKPAARKK